MCPERTVFREPSTTYYSLSIIVHNTLRDHRKGGLLQVTWSGLFTVMWMIRRGRLVQLPRGGLHPEQIMLCVWWNIENIVHYELLGNNQTITDNLYCNHSRRSKAVLNRKRSCLINKKECHLPPWLGSSSHCSTDQSSLGKAWMENIAPAYIFSRHLNVVRVTSREEIEIVLDSYFETKLNKFTNMAFKSSGR